MGFSRRGDVSIPEVTHEEVDECSRGGLPVPPSAGTGYRWAFGVLRGRAAATAFLNATFRRADASAVPAASSSAASLLHFATADFISESLANGCRSVSFNVIAGPAA